ncbi:AAA family ATPase [Lysinibacillus sp. OF-1]|uniref:AAA family ATPase n=1 Tax=Lysinibacillus sp. OF-1 TaxID=2972483 RepID=UPI00232E8322|nr:DUF3696 domain-containing protein [Lysinibacillus sp. OF-1]WCH48146.1 DUF3696 domain-containing protein [Lysinibacillus sp. OF-1]
MLKSWHLKGFKSIYERTNFDILPLTIFTGANSSGKSSVIQSILLSTQTIQNNVPSKPIILNGQIIRLGSFNDILSFNNEDKNITIGFELESSHVYHEEEEEAKDKNKKKNIISCTYKFSIKDDNEVSSLQPVLTNSKISIYNPDDATKILNNIEVKKTPLSISEKLKKYNIDSINERSYPSLDLDVISPIVPKNYSYLSKYRYDAFSSLNEVYIGAEMLHFIPQKIVSLYNRNELTAIKSLNFLKFPMYEDIPPTNELANPKLVDILNHKITDILNEFNTSDRYKHSNRNHFINSLADSYFKDGEFKHLSKFISVLPTAFSREWTEYIESNQKKLIELMISDSKPKYELSSRIHSINPIFIDEIVSYFNNKVKYLGPLRDEPKPIYPNSSSLDSKDVGYRGEYTAAVLELHKDTIINYYSPVDLELDEYIEKEGRLLDAVLEWLNYMGISENVKTYDRGKLGHELQVKLSSEGKYHDLTNVGVGVSQVLPILVMTLLAENNSTIIFEQPELHLHPKVQTRLADFFVTMIKLNKQCIVETHSEYLINRLRYKAVSSPKDNINKNVMIYFVEQEEGKSKYRPIQINDYGVIEDWPKGFFDEHEKNATAILKAARQKNRRK